MNWVSEFVGASKESSVTALAGILDEEDVLQLVCDFNRANEVTGKYFIKPFRLPIPGVKVEPELMMELERTLRELDAIYKDMSNKLESAEMEEALNENISVTLTNVNGRKIKLAGHEDIVSFYQVEYLANEGMMEQGKEDTLLDDALVYLVVKCRGTFPKIVIRD